MLAKDRSLNIKLSLFRHLYEMISDSYYINYSEKGDSTLEKRIADRVEGFWKWIAVFWVMIGPGIHSISKLQLNCNTIKDNDPFCYELGIMVDKIMEELNVDTIPLLDFSDDPENPIPTGNVLIPRFRGTKLLPN
jgi:hypothetical protein